MATDDRSSPSSDPASARDPRRTRAPGQPGPRGQGDEERAGAGERGGRREPSFGQGPRVTESKTTEIATTAPEGGVEPRPRSAAPKKGRATAKAGARGADMGQREPPASSGKTIVPPQAVAGSALISVVAIMCFLVCLAVGALSMVTEAARDWQRDVSREVTIQIKPLDGTAMEPRLAKALEIARATLGVRSARLVDERESAELLEPWLGKGLDLSMLPVPRLVVLDLVDPATADLAGLERRVGSEIKGAVVDDHAIWAARLRTMAGAVVLVGAAVVALMLTAMVLSVVFATRSAMAGNRDVIEVLHFVGAEDTFIAREFQHHFLVLGLKGGIGGGAAAIVCFFVGDRVLRSGRGDAFVDQANALFGGASVGLTGHLGVLAVVGVVALLTAVTSRATVLGQLRRLG